MAEINDVYGSICQNLIDVGCDEHVINDSGGRCSRKSVKDCSGKERDRR